MERILEPNDSFPFDQLVLSTPTFMNTGNYFIKYSFNDSPLYIQPPKCVTKQGIIKAGKKMYCDMLFTNEHESLIQWMENLETYSQNYIFQRRSQWFESDLEMHDIENSFTPSMKVFKSGKFYIIRTLIPTRLGKCTLKIFNEDENEVPLENIKDMTPVVTIWEVLGIKCTTRSFQIDIEVKQMMVINPITLFETCIISTKRNSQNMIGQGAESHQPTQISKVDIHEDELNEGDSGYVHSQQQKPSLEQLTQKVTSSLRSEEEFGNVVEPSGPNSSTEETKGVYKEQIESRKESYNGYDILRRSPEEYEEISTIKISEPLNQEKSIDTSLEEPSNDSFNEPLEEEPTNEDDEETDSNEDDSPYEILEDEEGLENIPDSSELEIVDLNLQDIQENMDFQLKNRNDVYYEIYEDAKKKAEEDRNLAISSYLEAKRIKELYMIQYP
jgi:hypothetical protein